MTPAGLATRVRYLTKQDSTTLTDATLVLLANTAKDEICELIVQRNEDFFIVPTLIDTVTSSISAREYPLPDDVLNHMVTVEMAFSSSTPLDYVPVRPYRGGLQNALINTDGLTEAKIIQNFTNTRPYYFLTRRSLYILSGSITAIISGLKIRYRAYPADLSAVSGTTDMSVDPSTTTFGIPKQFHELLCRRISIEWKGAHPGAVPLSPLEERYEQDLEKKLQAIEQNDLAEEEFSSLPLEDMSGSIGYNL